MTRVDHANAWLNDYRERVPERTLEMARLHIEQGMSYAEIGAQFGISRQRVGYLLRPLGLESQHVDRRAAEREQRLQAACTRILAGETTLAWEAEQLGYVSARSLRATMNKIGLKPKRPPPEEPEHGTLVRYNSAAYRCRCEECRRANREATAALTGKEPPEHGTLSAYQNYACRCKLCREAARVVARQKRTEKRRQKGVIS